MVDDKDIRLTVNLDLEQKAAVRIENKKTKWFKIEQGVRQGCALSLDIFRYTARR